MIKPNIWQWLLIGLLFVMNAHGSEQPQLSIKLWPVINISSNKVSIGMLGSFSDKKLNRLIKKKSTLVDIKPGQYQFVNKVQLKRLFSIPKNIKLLGPRFVKISRLGYRIKMTPLVSAAKALLKKNYGENITLEPLANVKPLEVSSRNYHWQLSHQKKGGSIARLCVLVEVSYGGTKRKTVPLWFKAIQEKPVWVLTTDVATKSHFSPIMVMLESRNIANVQGQVLHQLPDLKQQRFSASYQQGRMLTTDMLETIPAVEKNQPVVVTSISGRVRINTKAIALADAKLKQRVKVKSLSSGEAYLTTVVGKNTVVAGY